MCFLLLTARETRKIMHKHSLHSQGLINWFSHIIIHNCRTLSNCQKEMSNRSITKRIKILGKTK